jgi:hypothetical protein
MRRTPKKRRGKYYGKLKSIEEVEMFKQYIINRYNRTPLEKRNVPNLVDDLRDKGFIISYNTVYGWLRKAEVKIVKNPKRLENKKVVNISISLDIDELMEDFKPHLTRTFLLEQAVNMLFGLPMDNLVLILFKEGNVLITKNKDKLIALTTNNLKSADLHFLQGMVTLAEEAPDWVKFIQKYAKASGILHYPL